MRRHACLGTVVALVVLPALVAAGSATAAPEPRDFMFIVYGDSRADKDCKGNAIHMGLLKRIAAANPAFVVNTGDMITGFAKTTNFVSRGDCAADASNGSLKEIIAPLQKRTPPPGLNTTFFPVVGNHDDNWGSKWYPDAFNGGFCDVFDPKALVPNHTGREYFSRHPKARRYSDADFYRLACSTTERDVFSKYWYYSFDYQDTHFVVLRVNNNHFDLEVCQVCKDPSNYDDYYNIHQLDFLRADLAAARRNPNLKNIYVFLHAPLFGSGDVHPNSASARALTALFTAHGVKVGFSGHSHLYERSVPVAVDKNSPAGVLDVAKGTVYVTTGGGGSALHSFKPAPWYSASRKSAYHYVEVRVLGSKMRLRAIDSDGKVIDEVTR